ncbi:hypothetical protein [Streptomyces sp. XD-27]|uniref:hypothetical protein n=1 Tax=Streptomyces sp. XD-27 TaxID=3062779 RepID=UPI0026F43B5D|nr:hypothetical protein [Streptomyces sp. XD-27]WKX72142.1 hypothetical protein Q3Y56_21545 [Streptomyces sp. XD-27]
MRHIGKLLPLLLLPLALTACGTETSAAAADGFDRAELEARARALGTELDMVYVTDIPGYKVAPQSVGVIGDHGFGSFYVDSGSGRIELRVDERRGAPTGERDGESWYSAEGGTHEYVREDGGRVISLSADQDDVTRDTLRKAVEQAHQADDDELAEVLPPVRNGGGQGGTERGDLPATGDGAPQDPPGFTEGTSG